MGRGRGWCRCRRLRGWLGVGGRGWRRGWWLLLSWGCEFFFFCDDVMRVRC